MEYEVYNTNALHFPRLLKEPQNFIDFCIEQSKITNTPWQPWLSGGDVVPHAYGELWTINGSGAKETSLLDLYDLAVITSLEQFLSHIQIPNDVARDIVDEKTRTRPRALAVKRYYEGEELGPHPDIDPSKDVEHLNLTVSMYFNDEYDGGLLGFMDGSKIDLTPGSVVIFPASYLHESSKVTNGIKYVSNEVISIERSKIGVVVQ